jgi:hypothetical protein
VITPEVGPQPDDGVAVALIEPDGIVIPIKGEVHPNASVICTEEPDPPDKLVKVYGLVIPVTGDPPGNICIVKGPTPAVGLIVAVPLVAEAQDAGVVASTSPVTPGPTPTVAVISGNAGVVQPDGTWVTTTLYVPAAIPVNVVGSE